MKNVVTHRKFQRYSALAISPLSIWIIYSIICMKGSSFQETYNWFSNPFNAFFMAAFFIISFLHLKLGLQIIIEDYVPNLKHRSLTILSINIACYIFAGIAIFSILTMLF